MKGLLIKDLKIVMQQKRFFLIMLAFSLFFLFESENGSGAFAVGNIGYMTFLMLMVLVGTISYDEFDNGYTFLFSLPIQRKDYVKEKYVLCTLGCIAACVVGVVLGVAVSAIRMIGYDWGEWIVVGISIGSFTLVVMSLLLPVQLKYGGAKSRAVMIIIAAGIVVVGMLLARFGDMITLDIILFLQSLSVTAIIAVELVASIVAVVISMMISVRIMEKKEF